MDTSSRQWIVCAAVLAALTTCGCDQAQKQKWDDFFNNNKKSSKQPTQTTPPVKASTVQRSAEGQHPTPKQDAQEQDVDQKVDHYVQSMNSSDTKYKSDRQVADASKPRQSEPNGDERVQKTAARESIDASDDTKSVSEPKSTDSESTPRTPAVIPPPKIEPTPLPVSRVEEIKANPSDSDATEKSDDTKTAQTDEPKIEPKPATVQPTGKPTASSDESAPSWSYDHFNAKFDSKSADNTKTKPPVVENIKIEAAPEKKDDATAAPAAPAARANTPPSAPPSSEAIKSRIAEQEARVAKDPNNVDEQFKLRLLYLSDNQDEKALASTPGINGDILDIMRAQIQSLISARASAQRDPALWANRQLEAIENLRSLVRARADIKVAKVAICRSITSFGVYEPIDPPNFKLGQRNAMFLYVPIENFKTERTASGLYRTLLSIRYSVIDSNGKELWSDKIENIEDTAREHRQDFYLGVGPEGGFVLPPRWGPGEYTIKVEVEDMLAQKINSNTTKFKIVS